MASLSVSTWSAAVADIVTNVPPHDDVLHKCYANHLNVRDIRAGMGIISNYNCFTRAISTIRPAHPFRRNHQNDPGLRHTHKSCSSGNSKHSHTNLLPNPRLFLARISRDIRPNAASFNHEMHEKCYSCFFARRQRSESTPRSRSIFR